MCERQYVCMYNGNGLCHLFLVDKKHNEKGRKVGKVSLKTVSPAGRRRLTLKAF
jgi:hypothetical protein